MAGDCSRYRAAYNPQRMRGQMAGAEQTARIDTSLLYDPAQMSQKRLREMICRNGHRLEDCSACPELCGYGREWLRRKGGKSDVQGTKTDG